MYQRLLRLQDLRRVSLGGARRGCLGLAALLLLLYPVNSVFYSGWGGGGVSCRLEHGRLRVTRSDREVRETFYVAGNSEPQRFAPEWRRRGPGDWEVQIPLWLPAAAAIAAALALRAREARA